MSTSNREVKPKKGDKYDMMDSDLPSLSQLSNDSDKQQQVPGFVETLERCLAAEMEKKRPQKEKKFLETAEAHLNHHIENSARDVRDAMKIIDAIYSTFLMEYAACEDRIQKKYLQLQQLQANLVVGLPPLKDPHTMAKEVAEQDEEANKISSGMQVKGLSKTRTSCTAFSKILQQLNLEDAKEMNEE